MIVGDATKKLISSSLGIKSAGEFKGKYSTPGEKGGDGGLTNKSVAM